MKPTMIKSCKYCLDGKGQPKPIWPEKLPYAKRMADGSFMCQVCQTERLIKLMAPKE